MIVGALLLLIFGGPPDEGAAAPAPPAPTLRLVSPADGQTVASPLVLTFESESPLSRQQGGWGTGSYHIHAEIDGREAMPGPADIRRLADGAYAWSLGTVPPGPHRLRLYWSDPAHLPLSEGATALVTVRVE
jgi:hypothetical protein